MIADSVVTEARVFALCVACNLGQIVDVKKLGPVLATLLDAQILTDPDFEKTVKAVRGQSEHS